MPLAEHALVLLMLSFNDSDHFGQAHGSLSKLLQMTTCAATSVPVCCCTELQSLAGLCGSSMAVVLQLVSTEFEGLNAVAGISERQCRGSVILWNNHTEDIQARVQLESLPFSQINVSEWRLDNDHPLPVTRLHADPVLRLHVSRARQDVMWPLPDA